MVDEEFESQTSYTIDLDLPTAGKVSTLWLILHARTLTTNAAGNPWARNLISSISVNQAGQEQLNAVPPDFFQADYYYKTGKFPQIGTRRWGTAGDIEEVIPIMFGDKVDDLDYYVDLGRLNDPQISVTYDLASTDNEGSATWDTTYYPRFSVIADLLEGPGLLSSKGYHSLRQIEKYTPTNSQVKQVELKGARPIKQILFQFDLTNIAYVMRQSVDRVKLWGSNEAYVPFNMTAERYKNLVKMLFGTGVAKGNFDYWYGGRTINNIFDERDYIDMMLHNSKLIAAFAYGGSGHGFVLEPTTMSTGAADYATALSGFFEFAGIAPWAIYPIDARKMLGMEYLDPMEHAPLYLELTHVSNATTIGGDIRVAVEDLAQQ